MGKSYGFELLEEQVIDHLAAEVAYKCASMQRSDSYGDTPIEKLLCGAMAMRMKYFEESWYRKFMFVRDDQIEGIKRRSDAKEYIFIQKQAQLPQWRVDFIFNAYASWRRKPGGGTIGWKQLIVECDGHDFHERTKEQAAKDRSRDREVQAAGYEIFRFTGSELWKDPMACAKQVLDWAESKL